MIGFRSVAAALTLCTGLAGAAQAQTTVDGKQAYATSCASCHAEDLSGGTGPALKGDTFKSHWSGDHGPKELLGKIRTTMPVGTAGSLPMPQYIAITLYIMSQNGMGPNAAPPAAATH